VIWPLIVRSTLAVLYFGAVAVAFAFMVLPVVAIFFHVPITDLLSQLTSPVVKDALIVTFKAIVVSQVVILGFGTPTAWFLASRRFRGRAIAVTLVELPIVLPPAVAGIGLIVAFGRYGLLGSTFDWLGINVSFNLTAVVLAITLVSGPFYVRQAIASFEAVDWTMIAASRTLGAGALRTFFRITLPLARGGLLAGESLCLARGMGEFGATILFAGSLQGRTQTLPLAVYNEFEGVQLTTALSISALLVVLSLSILLILKVGVLWQPSRQNSVSPFGRST
jgi:molybdate transport system permease protein